MSLVPRIGLPAMIEQGRDTAVTLDVYSAASAQQTASAGTLKLYAGSELVLEDVNATGLGPPATYTVLAAVTADRAVSADWMFVWSLTIAGVVYLMRQPAYLVKHLLYPSITDDDLTDVHSGLDSLRDTAQMTSFEPFRTLAWTRINRMLIKRGNRPALILDSWALTDLHVYMTLELIFNDFVSSISADSGYADQADRYAAKAASEWAGLVFRYDESEDGTITGDERRGSPVLMLNAPRGRGLTWPR